MPGTTIRKRRKLTRPGGGRYTRRKKEAGICVKCKKPATHKIWCYEHYIAAKRNGQQQALRKRNERQDAKAAVQPYNRKGGNA